jgi:hypothetical protein
MSDSQRADQFMQHLGRIEREFKSLYEASFDGRPCPEWLRERLTTLKQVIEEDKIGY